MIFSITNQLTVFKLKEILKYFLIFRLIVRKYRIVNYKTRKLIERIRYSRRPNILGLEPSNICTSNCIFCSYQYDQLPKKIPSFDEFQGIVEEYTQMGGDSIQLTPITGEIFTNKKIIDWIKKLDSFKSIKHIGTYTNASLFHTIDLDELVNSGLTGLHISVPPLDEEIYLKIYRSNLYSKVISNLKNLLIAFSNANNKTIKLLEISFRADRTLDECKQLPDYLEFVHPYLSEGVIVTSMSSFDSWSGMIKDSDLLPGMELLHTELSGPIQPCSRIYNAQIVVDGSIRLCGARIDNGNNEDELKIGHISELSLTAAYNSPKAKKIRDSFRSGNLLNICQKCSWYEK
ncbi:MULTISPECIES: radical SAM protein [Nostocales]|jgi:MoaA/NifB/PqqE/SkfB family radical SAM enzyme|uniref:Radical SAM protein n=1 Tax=Dolichospermum flos-aquae UHCC 0037 TaxID=2590026 RepID=A0ACC7S897_DOLFA|nr:MULTISPECIES: radical SAM protein [Nostocales]MBO1066295.1 radical SAM protein [Anabaena sp. 54]MTJ44737.1 radical SAM protein [Dolichospermum flos-aquae UHCC 0037]